MVVVVVVVSKRIRSGRVSSDRWTEESKARNVESRKRRLIFFITSTEVLSFFFFSFFPPVKQRRNYPYNKVLSEVGFFVGFFIGNDWKHRVSPNPHPFVERAVLV